jgi:subtilisin family serine protease
MTRVAVIDSGVNPRHPHIAGVSGGASINAACEVEEGAYLDTLGHGTAVMAAIQEKAPDAEYFAVKVFHTALRTSADCLLRAIDWAIENRMDLVNLSLGTTSIRRAADFKAIVAKAAHSVKLVSARDADNRPCYPGCLPGVISVALDWNCDRDHYRIEGNTYFASGYPRPVPGVPPARNLQGISFAVANITGFFASSRLCASRF